MDTRPEALSIDENSANQKLVEKILSDQYEVKAVLPGHSSIEELYLLQPDAILLDVDKSDTDGIRWCRMIRSEPALADTPILFVSCPSHPNPQQSFQAAGDGGTDKPIDIHVLKQKRSLKLDQANQNPPLASMQQAPGQDQNTQYLQEYLLALLSLDDLGRLGQLILNTLGKMGLKGAVYRHHDQHTNSSIGPLSDLEAILLQQANQTYPMDHSARFLWGSKYLGAIIQNMPSPKDSQYQPLRQILITLFKAADQTLEHLHRTSAYQRPPTPRTATGREARRDLVQQHGDKLERALEILETQSEKNLSSICQGLQRLAGELGLSHQERQTAKTLLDQCMAVRLAIYDQCLEVQAQYHQMRQYTDIPTSVD